VHQRIATALNHAVKPVNLRVKRCNFTFQRGNPIKPGLGLFGTRRRPSASSNGRRSATAAMEMLDARQDARQRS
jgi:hypothetical protein